MPDELLPTISSPTGRLVSFYESLIEGLAQDSSGESIRMFYYAVTHGGWLEVRKSILEWKQTRGKPVFAYIGTDHALTDPDALQAMMDDGIEVRIMRRYSGAYHPKVVWISGRQSQRLWVGSNNLTSQGLRDNIEFAVQIVAEGTQPLLDAWFDGVHKGSDLLDDNLLKSYTVEREKYSQKKASIGKFKWTGRSKLPPHREEPAPPPIPNTLYIEVLTETGGGCEVQFPVQSLARYLGISPGDQRELRFEFPDTGDVVERQMSHNDNNTHRVYFGSLRGVQRPALLVITRIGLDQYRCRILTGNDYNDLINEKCTERTSSVSRRWGIE